MKKFTNSVPAICFLFVVCCFSATAQTNVSGGIYTDTTWTLANSPYIVVDTVVVFPGVTLTIQPGVTVKFANNKRIEIRQANIICSGTITDSITFTSNSATPTAGIYEGLIAGNGNLSNFNYCNFHYANVGLEGPNCSVKNSLFKNNITGISAFCSQNFSVDSCIFLGNTTGLSEGSLGLITNSFFSGNQTAITGGGGCSISNSLIQNCVIVSNNIGINSCTSSGTRNLIKNCRIDSNQTGINIYSGCSGLTIVNGCSMRFNTVAGYVSNGGGSGDSIGNCQLKNNRIGIIGTYYSTIVTNDIENNDTGVVMSGIINSNRFSCNKICNNTIYNFKYTGISNVNIPNNYWCSTDSATIDSLIYDGYKNISLGIVHFRPVDSIGCYLTGCNLGITATVTNATCDTCHNGHATAVITNGHTPYNYTWFTSPIQTTATATGLSAGTYKLCVVDGNGCTACNQNIFVDSTNCNGFHISTVGTNETCFTCSDGSATVNVTGGTAPFAYSWYTSPLQSTQTATNLSHGHYAVCVTDLYGCSACDSVAIGTGNCSAHFNLYPDTVPHTYTAVNMASGVPPLRYNWNWGDGSAHDTIAYPSHAYASAGYYSICLSITDSAGCTNTYCNNFYLLRPDNNAMVIVNVIAPLATGINEATNQPISIFPNPASDLLTVIFSKSSSPSQFKIFNMLGELKYSSLISSQRTNIDISGLASGVYLIEVITENNILRQKFIKQQGNR